MPESLIIANYERREALDDVRRAEDDIARHRRDAVRVLAASGGDAAVESFVAVVERLEQAHSNRREAETRRDGVREALLERTTARATEEEDLPEDIRTPTHTAPPSIEGQWFTLTKPTYGDCLGLNDDGDPLYKLGKMSFEMFRPGNLVCAIQAVFNSIGEVGLGDGRKNGARTEKGEGRATGEFEDRRGGGDEDDDPVRAHGISSVPKNLEKEVRRALRGRKTAEGNGGPVLRTYNIVTAFTVEPYSPVFGNDSPNRTVAHPIKGIMTTEGYVLPDPDKPGRLTVWFAGGKMECGERRNSDGFRAWKRIFGRGDDDDDAAFARDDGDNRPSSSSYRHVSPASWRRRTFREGGKVLMARLLMGATGYDDGMDEDTGEMHYSFSRPMGGHGKAYVDVLHLDDRVRIMRGNKGTLYTFARVNSGS